MNGSWRGICHRGGLTLCSLLLLTGCVTTNLATSGFTILSANSSVLLMPPDIKYYRVTASGITEPNADWTSEARASFGQAFAAYSKTNQLEILSVNEDELTDIAVEYDKLHSAIGRTILVNHFGVTKLPAKNQQFDWSLGPGAMRVPIQRKYR